MRRARMGCLPVSSPLVLSARVITLISRSASSSLNSFLLGGVGSVLGSVFSSPSSALDRRCEPSRRATLAIIADLTPNSQLAPARSSVLIIYRLPRHLQLTVDQRAAALFLLTLPLENRNATWSTAK